MPKDNRVKISISRSILSSIQQQHPNANSATHAITLALLNQINQASTSDQGNDDENSKKRQRN